MQDKYVKSIKDEIKGRMKDLIGIKSVDASVAHRTYQYALDIIEHYEKKDQKEIEKRNEVILEQIRQMQADAVYDCDMETVRVLDKVAEQFKGEK